MNSTQLIYRGKLRLSFDIPFLDTPFYLHASHLYTSTLFHAFSCGSAHGSAYGFTYVSSRGSSYGSSYALLMCLLIRVSARVSLHLLLCLFTRLMGG